MAEHRGQSRRALGLGGRKRTISAIRGAKPDIATPPNQGRPIARSECAGGDRPCPWMSCRYHLALDITRAGALVVNFPDREIEDLAETCALDVADRGGATLETVGKLMNLTKERARQIEVRGCIELAAALRQTETENQ